MVRDDRGKWMEYRDNKHSFSIMGTRLKTAVALPKRKNTLQQVALQRWSYSFYLSNFLYLISFHL